MYVVDYVYGGGFYEGLCLRLIFVFGDDEFVRVGCDDFFGN